MFWGFLFASGICAGTMKTITLRKIFTSVRKPDLSHESVNCMITKLRTAKNGYKHNHGITKHIGVQVCFVSLRMQYLLVNFLDRDVTQDICNGGN